MTSTNTVPPPGAPAQVPPPPGGTPATVRRARRRPRWGRRIFLTLLLLLLAGVAWLAFAGWRLDSSIERIPTAELPSLDPVTSGPVNYLLVGSDSRENLEPELGGFFGDFAGQRADVIMLMHVVPGKGKTQLLSIPRDLKVDIPSQGTNRVNAAYAFGGPELLVQTVKRATGLPIHHYVEVGFAQFADVVDGLGGVEVTFPFEARDNKSGLAVPAGAVDLDGAQAVAFVRSREYEELQNGSWVGVEQGDIGRTARQQQVLGQLLDKATSPARLLDVPFVAGDVGAALKADGRLGIADLAKLGFNLVRAGEIEAATLPVRDSTEGGVAFVVAVEPDAGRVLQAFQAGNPMR